MKKTTTRSGLARFRFVVAGIFSGCRAHRRCTPTGMVIAFRRDGFETRPYQNGGCSCCCRCRRRHFLPAANLTPKSPSPMWRGNLIDVVSGVSVSAKFYVSKTHRVASEKDKGISNWHQWRQWRSDPSLVVYCQFCGGNGSDCHKSVSGCHRFLHRHDAKSAKPLSPPLPSPMLREGERSCNPTIPAYHKKGFLWRAYVRTFVPLSRKTSGGVFCS